MALEKYLNLLVCNKIDQLDDVEPRIDRDENGHPIRVWLSARQGVGIELLFVALTERLGKKIVKHCLKIPPHYGKLRGMLYKLNCIDNESYDDNGNCLVDIKLPKTEWERLIKQDNAPIESFIER